jgi:hypothetical protein
MFRKSLAIRERLSCVEIARWGMARIVKEGGYVGDSLSFLWVFGEGVATLVSR